MEQKEYVMEQRLSKEDLINEIYSLTVCYNQIIETGGAFSEAKGNTIANKKAGN
jgi:hypothetical protein